MLMVKRLNFSGEEIERMVDDLDGYVWIVMDIKKGIVAVGDEYVGKMKNALMKQSCSIYNIFGVGFDLQTGEIDYYSSVNVKWVDKRSTKEAPEMTRGRIEDLVRYFFVELPVFKQVESNPRYSKGI